MKNWRSLQNNFSSNLLRAAVGPLIHYALITRVIWLKSVSFATHFYLLKPCLYYPYNDHKWLLIGNQLCTFAAKYAHKLAKCEWTLTLDNWTTHGPNPTIASYNASVVKIYNATNIIARFKNIFLRCSNTLVYNIASVATMIGARIWFNPNWSWIRTPAHVLLDVLKYN
jgi:hypothetical protein